MFQKLQKKWKVGSWQLLLVICTFALGGSLCGYLGKKLMNLTGLEKGWAWFLLYLVLVSLIWPLCVIVISIPLGQFRFFKGYLQKLWGRIRGKRAKKINIALFASGKGSNVQRIIEYFNNHSLVAVKLVISNNPEAGVLQIAKDAGIPTLIIENDRFKNRDGYLPLLQEAGISWLVLAGFLWKIPPVLINAYPRRIVNIHPALLPQYGGKGMYGEKVHAAVLAAGEKLSGITIHYADEEYDHGPAIFQTTCPVEPGETAATLAAKIQRLEHRHYPEVLEKLFRGW